MNPITQAQQYLANPQCNEQTLMYVAQNFPQLHGTVANHPAATYQVLGYLSTYSPDPTVRSSAAQRLSLAPSGNTTQITSPQPHVVPTQQAGSLPTPSQQYAEQASPYGTYGPPQYQQPAPVSPIQPGDGQKTRRTGIILLAIAGLVVVAFVIIAAIGGGLGWLSGSKSRMKPTDYSLQPIKVSMPGESEVWYSSSNPALRLFAVTNWDTESVVVYRMEDEKPVEVLAHSSDELIGLTNDAAIFAEYEYDTTSPFIVKKGDVSSGDVTVIMDLADKIPNYTAGDRQPPIVISDQIVAMEDDQTLRAFDLDGNETWSYSLMSFNTIEYLAPISTHVLSIGVSTGDYDHAYVVLDARTGESLLKDIGEDAILTQYVDGFAVAEHGVATFYQENGEPVGTLNHNGGDYLFYDECSNTVQGAYDAYTSYFHDHSGSSNPASLCDGHVISMDSGKFSIDGETVTNNTSPWFSCDKTTKSCVVLDDENGEFFGLSLENPSQVYWSHTGGSWFWRGNGYAGVESPENDIFYIVGR